jgi:hypothetical protein
LAIFGGGHTTFYLTPALKKNIKTYVVDKNRQKEIFQIMDASKKNQKVFFKTRKKYIKEAKQLTLKRNTTKEQFNAFTTRYFTDREAVQDYSIDAELAIKHWFSPSEWGQMVDAFPEKVEKDKLRKKYDKDIAKKFKRIKNVSEKHLVEDKNKATILASIDTLHAEIKGFIPRVTEVNYQYLKTIRDHDVSREAYIQLADSILQIRMDILYRFIDTRSQIRQNTSDKGWKGMMKAYNKLLDLGLIL